MRLSGGMGWVRMECSKRKPGHNGVTTGAPGGKGMFVPAKPKV